MGVGGGIDRDGLISIVMQNLVLNAKTQEGPKMKGGDSPQGRRKFQYLHRCALNQSYFRSRDVDGSGFNVCWLNAMVSTRQHPFQDARESFS